jgi:hypothetical protein
VEEIGLDRQVKNEGLTPHEFIPYISLLQKKQYRIFSTISAYIGKYRIFSA